MVEDSIQVIDYVDVSKKALDLNCNSPTKFCVLPRNFADVTNKDELLHEENTTTIIKILKKEGIEITPLEKETDKFSEISEHDAIFVAPILYFAAQWCLEHPEVITTVLQTIVNHLRKSALGFSGGKVKLSVVTESKSGKFRKVDYQGPVDGMEKIADIVKSTLEDEP